MRFVTKLAAVAWSACLIGACSLFVDTSGLSDGESSDGAAIDSASDVNANDAASDAATDATDAAATTYVANVMADGPLAYWRLGEKTGQTIVDQGGKYPGAVHGTVTLGVPGALSDDTAVRFDGVTGYIDFGDVLDFTNDAPFTIEAWVDPTDFDASAGIQDVISKIGYGTAYDGYSLAFNDQLHFYECTNEQAPCLSAMSSAPQSSRFTYVVATYDGTTAAIFFDGTLIASLAVPSKKLVDNPYTLRFGAEQGSGFFSGTIDEVAFYDHVLPLPRIEAHFAARK